jgi:hypothetical protein
LFEILFDVVSVLLGEKLTKRIKLYSGDDILGQIEEFGIGPTVLPVDLCGEVALDQEQWLADRERNGK